jgi:4-hydroxy-2-oxoheptanedioate aldolase
MMRPNLIQQRLRAGQPILNGWLSIPSSYSAEGMGHAGFHSVTVDMQHGMIGFADALHMLQALSATPATPLIRVSRLDGAEIMRALDAGSYGVICPMIRSAQDAELLVSSCRYPPVGTRSFGPARGLLFGGTDYFDEANETLMAIPMIETIEAVECIDAILAVDGVDMIYVGPNDTALAYDGHVVGARTRAEAAIAHVLARARVAGVATGIFCADAQDAARRLDQGFDLVTPGNDMGLLKSAATSAIAHIEQRGEAPKGTGTTGSGY